MADNAAETPPDATPAPDAPVNFDDWTSLISLVREAEDLPAVRAQLLAHIRQCVLDAGLSHYTVLFLHHSGSIDEGIANRLYNALPKEKNQSILLVLNSSGGLIEPAYLISKCLKEYSRRFVACVPRKAKSAATLLALGAHEIHMGSMSQLGPIDPQIRDLPALGLSSALDHLAQLCERYPKSSEMFASYLSSKLDLQILGYFERVSESAVQYAQRLLDGKTLPPGMDATTVARQFVYGYKDHSFVIDSEEAARFLGDHIKTGSPEYQFGDRIHNFLQMLDILAKFLKQKAVSAIGVIDNCLDFRDAEDDDEDG